MLFANKNYLLHFEIAFLLLELIFICALVVKEKMYEMHILRDRQETFLLVVVSLGIYRRCPHCLLRGCATTALVDRVSVSSPLLVDARNG